MGPLWRRRVAVITTYIAFVPMMGIAVYDRWETHPYLPFLCVMVVTELWIMVSVFRLVKSFDDGAEGMGKMMRVNGLDDWARYRYGVDRFDLATEEQQKDLINRYRVGVYSVPRKACAVQELDREEIKEQNRAEHWALKQLSWYLCVSAGTYLHESARHRQLDAMEAAIWLWAFVLLAQTLPKARVLWTEEYPREESCCSTAADSG